ncbi:TPA: DNA-binding protein [Neisseria meningitidis]|uniref:DNA-binding protein n=1 Tax=Neisseria meningitidis TaxID=487 RepID=UPI0030590DA0
MINHECINQPYGRILKFSRVQAKEMLTADELKENFAKNGQTLAQWARENSFKPRDVYLVIGGQRKGNYGKGHEIAKKLGLK